MKKSFIYKMILLFLPLMVTVFFADAQPRKRTGRTTGKKVTSKKNKKEEKTDPVKKQLAEFNYDSIRIKPAVVSLEPDYIHQGKPLQPAGVLAYETISEDDVAYRQRVWRDIDVREKMNQPFMYNTEDDNGSPQLINVLISAIRDDPAVVAYSAIDDRFTKPLTRRELSDIITGRPYVDRVPDWVADPTGNKLKDTVIVKDFNPAAVTKFRLKEDWVFNKKTSKLVVRILGIAPIEEDSLSIPGEKHDKALFWLYYPKLRNTLTKYQVYNGKNHGARPTWEEMFESRMFSSSIVKSTLDNPGDVYLNYKPGLKGNNLLRLKEGEKINNTILDYEQNLWSY
jgi:gliding motility associated protien GldN